MEWWPGGNEEREADDGLTDDARTNTLDVKKKIKLFSGKKY